MTSILHLPPPFLSTNLLSSQATCSEYRCWRKIKMFGISPWAPEKSFPKYQNSLWEITELLWIVKKPTNYPIFIHGAKFLFPESPFCSVVIINNKWSFVLVSRHGAYKTPEILPVIGVSLLLMSPLHLAWVGARKLAQVGGWLLKGQPCDQRVEALSQPNLQERWEVGDWMKPQ